MTKNQPSTTNKQSTIFFIVIVLIIGGLVSLFMKTARQEDNQISRNTNTKGALDSQVKTDLSTNDFLGDKGQTLTPQEDTVYIAESEVNDGNLHAFNLYSSKSGKNLYFFIVKASDNTYRAAANACEVCFSAKTGFKQIGDQIRCENCRTLYSKDQIALQKGGCNPRPIDKDVAVDNGRLSLNLSDLEKIADLF